MNNHIRKYTLLASLLLHVLYFGLAGILNLFVFEKPEPPADEQEIVFELQAPKEERRPTEVIETPEDADRVPPDKADFLSDKNARARNEESNPDLDVGDAFARGDFNVHELPTNQMPIGAQPRPEHESDEERQSEQNRERMKPDPEQTIATRPAPVFRRELLVKSSSVPPGVKEQRQRVRHDNQQSRAPDMGALSFNTYDWDFAPYMLELKRKVEGNIYPPPAFVRLGLISGETVLRFRILPNGEVEGLEVMDSKGHHTLMETSYRAIEISGPFAPLPADFPEAYLEVTARFSYFVDKQR